MSDPGLCRVAIHAGTCVVDLALPSDMPVAILIPSIVDIVEGRDADNSEKLTARRYQLCRPGTAALRTSMTLAQSAIRDGDILVLIHSTTLVPAPSCDDPATAVSATLHGRTRGWSTDRQTIRITGALAAGWLTGAGALGLIRDSFDANAAGDLRTTAVVAGLAGLVALISAALAHRAYHDPVAGLTLGAAATAFVAVAGFLAVPGPPGVPNVLLAATAATATSALACRVSGAGSTIFTAIGCFAMVIGVAALVGVVTAAPLRAIGSVSVLISLGLLGASARLSIILAGLSPKLPAVPDLDTFEPSPDWVSAKAIHADAWLASLLAAFSSSAAVGCLITILADTPRLGCIVFSALTGALLLLRANSIDSRSVLVCVISGVITTGTTLGITAVSYPQHGPWIAAATATLVAAAIYLGFAAPVTSTSLVVHRGVQLLELLALVAMAPMTCWICGLYDAASGLYPAWG